MLARPLVILSLCLAAQPLLAQDGAWSGRMVLREYAVQTPVEGIVRQGLQAMAQHLRDQLRRATAALTQLRTDESLRRRVLIQDRIAHRRDLERIDMLLVGRRLEERMAVHYEAVTNEQGSIVIESPAGTVRADLAAAVIRLQGLDLGGGEQTVAMAEAPPLANAERRELEPWQGYQRLQVVFTLHGNQYRSECLPAIPNVYRAWYHADMPADSLAARFAALPGLPVRIERRTGAGIERLWQVEDFQPGAQP